MAEERLPPDSSGHRIRVKMPVARNHEENISMQHDYRHFAGELENLMGLSATALAITFAE